MSIVDLWSTIQKRPENCLVPLLFIVMVAYKIIEMLVTKIESNTSQEESPRNMSGRRGKNKKSGKVTQEYTVAPNDSAPKKLILAEDRAWIVSLLKDGDFDSASDFALKKQYITVKPNFDKSKQD
uniref:Uncharacterized protein n=1 Tax=Caenorhabditis japonica TaxID=281687 RepID=A0A8R1EIP9_CAEJA